MLPAAAEWFVQKEETLLHSSSQPIRLKGSLGSMVGETACAAPENWMEV